jgi:hypothetical protein
MIAPVTGYLLSEGGRYRLERIAATVRLLEHLASEGLSGPEIDRTGIAWDEFAAMTGLVSTELRAVLAGVCELPDGAGGAQ